MKSNLPLKFLVGFTAIFIAILAASFSVFGISKLLSGYFIAVIILGSATELGKLVSVSFLYQRWKTVNWGLRFAMFTVIITAMMITSGGLFGFLSSAYEKSSSQLNIQVKKVELLEKKKELFYSQIRSLEDQRKINEQRASQLILLRKDQEKRLDKIYLDSLNFRSARPTENIINKANIDIDSASRRVERFNSKINSLNDSIQQFDEQILQIQSEETSTDLGPLKYISRVFNISMDTVVKYLVLLLILITDPAAIILLMAYNQMILDKDKNFINKIGKEKKKYYINKLLGKLFRRDKELNTDSVEREIINNQKVENKIISEDNINDIKSIEEDQVNEEKEDNIKGIEGDQVNEEKEESCENLEIKSKESEIEQSHIGESEFESKNNEAVLMTKNEFSDFLEKKINEELDKRKLKEIENKLIQKEMNTTSDLDDLDLRTEEEISEGLRKQELDEIFRQLEDDKKMTPEGGIRP